LSTSSSDPSSSHLIPSYAASSSSDPSLHYTNTFLPPYAAYSTSSPTNKNNNSSSFISPHQYKHNKPTLPSLHQCSTIPTYTQQQQQRQHQLLKEKHLLCKLCNNLHSSPWHTTDMCPLKDSTFIVSKTIWENVMQHNNLHGKMNKNYHKILTFLLLSLNQPKLLFHLKLTQLL
jgi:hypothetical protein